MDARPILFIDALNCFARHYIRHPAMSSHGHQAGGIVGFLGSLAYLTTLTNPRAVYIIWESGGSPRRRAIFPGYKEGRKPPKLNRYYEDDIPDSKENRAHQQLFLTEVLKHVPVCQLFVENCEADDVIGYLSRNTFRDEKKIIASSDRDFYQLLDRNTMVYSWASKKFIGPDEVKAQFNISPSNFVLAKAVCGDVSDNVPGVKGVGFKGLAKRFDLTGDEPISVPELVKMAKEKCENGPKIFSSIAQNEELLSRNFRVMYLDTANLAAVQIMRIDSIIQSFKPVRNQIQLMRVLIDEGLGTFDALDFFFAFSKI